MESSCQIRALSGILIIVYKKQKKYKRVMEMLDRLELKAYGKINLGLDVVRKREDGYHEVRMIMQTVHLHDRIVMEKTKEPGIRHGNEPSLCAGRRGKPGLEGRKAFNG